jgi:hypothetical protein
MTHKDYRRHFRRTSPSLMGRQGSSKEPSRTDGLRKQDSTRTFRHLRGSRIASRGRWRGRQGLGGRIPVTESEDTAGQSEQPSPECKEQANRPAYMQSSTMRHPFLNLTPSFIARFSCRRCQVVDSEASRERDDDGDEDEHRGEDRQPSEASSSRSPYQDEAHKDQEAGPEQGHGRSVRRKRDYRLSAPRQRNGCPAEDHGHEGEDASRYHQGWSCDFFPHARFFE